MPWTLVVAMPAVSLERPIDAGDTAIVPATDQRYREITAASANCRRFLGAFRTAFGHTLQPAIVIREAAAGRILTEDLAALRNIVALSAVVRARVQGVIGFHGLGPIYADLFDVYPVQIGTQDLVVYQTATELGLGDDLERFQGQPHPSYINPHNVRPEFDDTLLGSLLRLWMSQPAPGSADHAFRRRVLRSLETAHLALMAPNVNLGSVPDHALACSLWVSAFEVLVSRPGHDASIDDVHRTIQRSRWFSDELQIERVATPRRSRKNATLPPVVRPSQVYDRLYCLRNQHLHGDAIDMSLMSWRLELPADRTTLRPRLAEGHWNHLTEAVPSVYRAVVLHLLAERGLHRFPQAPTVHDLGANDADRGARLDYQHYESPLLVRSQRGLAEIRADRGAGH